MDGHYELKEENMNDKIDNIRQWLEHLSQKRLELVKAHQQQYFWCRQQSERELEFVNYEIEHLRAIELEYLKLLQTTAAIRAPVPEMEWSESLFYWKRLAKLGLVDPFAQFNAVFGGIIGLAYSVSNFYKAHHLFKLTHCTPGGEQWTYHWARARATPQQIELSSYWIGRLQFRGFVALGSPLLYVFFMWSTRYKFHVDRE